MIKLTCIYVEYVLKCKMKIEKKKKQIEWNLLINSVIFKQCQLNKAAEMWWNN